MLSNQRLFESTKMWLNQLRFLFDLTKSNTNKISLVGLARYFSGCTSFLKNLKIFLWEKDAFDCAGIRAQVFRLPVFSLLFIKFKYSIICILATKTFRKLNSIKFAYFLNIKCLWKKIFFLFLEITSSVTNIKEKNIIFHWKNVKRTKNI